MKAFLELFAKGGLPMIGIVLLSVVLYSRCLRLLILLRTARGALRRAGEQRDRDALQSQRLDAQQMFQQQRIPLGAMIAAAPLLGLLGTVSGMAKTFASLGGGAGEKSLEGLARGISEVLVATEAGLAVAIPAMVLVFFAHREVRRLAQLANGFERMLRPEP